MMASVATSVATTTATATTTECVICMDVATDPYTVGCGSSTPHIICNGCELQWRLKSKPTPEGRIITCPMCRAVETDTSKRSVASLSAELSHVYFELATKNGKTPNQSMLRDYIRLLENVALVPHIQLDGLLGTTVPMRHVRDQVERSARAAPAVPSRERQRAERRARQETQEIQRQAGIQARERREAEERRLRAERVAAERQARAEQAAMERQARGESATAVWCESGNVLLGTCTTQRRTTRFCSVSGCIKRVCFRCDKCTSH